MQMQILINNQLYTTIFIGSIQNINLSNDDKSGSEWDLSTSKREFK